ncbi:glutamate carboxypeptidase [Kitasatospora xanthocidica]|nr:glutamate carboxypeptidase [Kitasatospora xanthocidica]
MHRSSAPQVDAMLDDLRRLVETESPSRDLVALRASAEAVAAVIEGRLGGRAVLVESEAGPHVHWSGGGEPRVLVLGHHDTVFPLGTLARRPFLVEHGRATGPGVFDMLGGLVQAVHGLAALEDTGGVEILVTADEEVGSGSSRALIEERARACGAVLVFEGAGEGGALKTGRKGCGTFEVSVRGRAAHAGLEPEAGVNALVEAAHQVLDLAALSRPEAGTTVTPTMASAGTTDNVVPAEATVTVDVRVESAEEKERIETAFARLRPHLDGAEIAVRGAVGRPPMPESASAELFGLARRLRPDLAGTAVGGGSDGNFTAALGIPTLDGLGAVGGGAHADHEYLLVDAMVPRARLVTGLVEAIRAGAGRALPPEGGFR